MSNEKNTGSMNIAMTHEEDSAHDDDGDSEAREDMGSTEKLCNTVRHMHRDRQSAVQEGNREEKDRDQASRGLRPPRTTVEDTENRAEDNKHGSKKMLDETETSNEKEQEDGRDGTIDVEGTENMGSLGKEDEPVTE